MRWAAVALLVCLAGCGPGGTTPIKVRMDANRLRTDLNEIAADAKRARNVVSPACHSPAVQAQAVRDACKAAEVMWDIFNTAWGVAWSSADLYEVGVMTLDEVVRAIAIVRRNGEEIADAVEVVCARLAENDPGSTWSDRCGGSAESSGPVEPPATSAEGEAAPAR